MRRITNIFFLTIVSFLLSPLLAQNFQFERKITPFPVLQINGTAYDQSLLGGMNTPLPDFVDIDGDGDADLFIKDRANRLVFMRNVGSNAAPQYQWETDDYQNLPIGAWFKFTDIDNDNDVDIFAENPFGIISLFRNEGSPTNPNFVLVIDSLKDDTGTIILVDGFSVPEWADIDCDGDKDLFLGRQSGYVTYYENTGTDGNNLPIFTLITNTFEDIYIISAAKTGGDDKQNNTRHGANSLSWVDIDNDNDLDLFWGDLFAPSIIFFENQGTCTNVDIDTSLIVESYPPGAPLSTGGFNVPRFTDIDGDNDYDMFVGIQGGAVSFIADQEANLYFYENQGNPSSPNFNLATKTLVSSVDIGRSSAPALADLDGDGDLDLFLSNKEDIDAPDLLNCRVFYFENQGTASSPQFRLTSENYLNYDKRLDLNYTSAFYDLDNSGTIDLLIGKWQGDLTFYRNDGTTTAPNLNRIDENFGGIDVGNDHAPTLADLDGDGDADMISGEFSGNLNFFRNTGSASNPVFTLEDQNYLGIDVGSFSSPHLADLDNDGDADLLVGSDDQGLVLFINNGTAQSPDFQLDATFQLADIPPDVHPTTGDLDNDGDLDLLCGTDGGGFIYYENMAITTGIEPTAANLPTAITLLSNYPNPFNPSTTIRIGLNLSRAQIGSGYTLTIYNSAGQRIKSWEQSTASTRVETELIWDGSNTAGEPVSSGVYFYELRLDNGIAKAGKMLLAR